MPTHRIANGLVAGSAGRCSGAVASAQAHESESSAAERSARTATRGCMGAIGSSACSLTPKSQTNLVLSVRTACFVTQEQHAPCSRLMLMSSAIGEASRRNTGVLAGRSLAAFGVFGCDRVCPDCLASLRPSERARASCRFSEAECGREWSGRKAGKSVIGRRRNSAEVRAVICASTAHARGSGFGATRLSPTKRMGRLCDAGVLARPRCQPGRDIAVALAVAKPRGLGN